MSSAVGDEPQFWPVHVDLMIFSHGNVGYRTGLDSAYTRVIMCQWNCHYHTSPLNGKMFSDTLLKVKTVNSILSVLACGNHTGLPVGMYQGHHHLGSNSE